VLPSSSISTEISQSLASIGKLWAASLLRPRIQREVQEQWDDLIKLWATSDLPLAIRKSGGVRGAVMKHQTGRELIIADNSPAQWSFVQAYERKVYTLEAITRCLETDEIPFTLVAKRSEKERMRYRRTLAPAENVNKRGWKLCHIQDIGLGIRTPLEEVPLDKLKDHFQLLMRPSNHFLIPLQWAGLGEVPEVIDAIRVVEAVKLA
jgi:hypothetical protein